MPAAPGPEVTVTPVAYFPEKYFLENLAVRADGSVLITTVPQQEPWLVPGPEPGRGGQPGPGAHVRLPRHGHRRDRTGRVRRLRHRRLHHPSVLPGPRNRPTAKPKLLTSLRDHGHDLVKTIINV
jgi:hypothetical protein